MKPQPDETLDAWVRQALDQLPDALPPGSTFDAKRLWGQMRPALPKTPARRWAGWMRWATAASVVGLLWIGFRFAQPPQSAATNQPTLTPMATHLTTTPKAEPKPESPGIPTVAVKLNRSRQRPTRSPVDLPTTPAPTPVASVDAQNVPDVTPAESARPDEPLAATALLTEPTTSSTVAGAPKRRFRVVHVNELRAEEEIRAKLYRTEGFVRLGTGRKAEPTRDEPTTVLILPLSSKTNP